MDICNARAKARESRERDESRAEQEAAAALKTANDAYAKTRIAIDAIKDPVRTLQRAITSKSSLFSQLFDDRKQLKDPRLGEEIYRYGMHQARAGLDAMRPYNGAVIGKIQKTSLDHLDRIFGSILKELDTSLAMADAITRQSASQNSQARSSPQPARQSANEECRVLRDADSSRALLARDQARWLQLMEACN